MDSSPLSDALALVDLGARRDADAIRWTAAAQKMCGHCIGGETVDEAAGRIIAEAYRDTLAILASPSSVHLNMLRGTIAWTPEHLRHLLGDSS